MRYNRPFYKSLEFKLPCMFIISFIAIIVFTAGIVYYRFDRRMLDEYKRLAHGSTELAKDVIDADAVSEYYEQGSENAGYVETNKKLMSIYENYPDIYYLYVYKFDEGAGHVIFDIYRENGEIQYDEPGGVYELDEPFASNVDKLVKGEEIPAYPVTDASGERLLSYINPVFDSEGNYVCHVCVDFLMNDMNEKDLHFAFFITMFMLAFLLVIGTADIYYVHKDIVKPLSRISDRIKDFSYNDEKDLHENVKMIEALDIHTDDELEDLYSSFLSVLKENIYYTTHLNKAKKIIKDNESKLKYMSKTMYKDELTRVGNKAAYQLLVEEINESIEKEEQDSRKFAIVMVDINNLKYINDNFGHDKGDEYIKGSCDIIAKIYAHSPIYRIGGDEFIVVLRDIDYERRQVLFAKTMIGYNFAFKDSEKEPWERYTASIGMADCTKLDSEFMDVFKRADSAMYESKNNFKKKNGSYR